VCRDIRMFSRGLRKGLCGSGIVPLFSPLLDCMTAIRSPNNSIFCCCERERLGPRVGENPEAFF